MGRYQRPTVKEMSRVTRRVWTRKETREEGLVFPSTGLSCYPDFLFAPTSPT